MKLPQEPLPNSNPNSENTSQDANGSEELDFGRELDAVEQSFHALKGRYIQVQQDQQTQAQLLARKEQVQQQLWQAPAPDLKMELKQLQAKLEELEFNLESRLFSFGSLKESFWQIIRFGGLGIVIGWTLAFCTMQQPQPEAPLPLPSSQSKVQP